MQLLCNQHATSGSSSVDSRNKEEFYTSINFAKKKKKVLINWLKHADLPVSSFKYLYNDAVCDIFVDEAQVETRVQL